MLFALLDVLEVSFFFCIRKCSAVAPTVFTVLLLILWISTKHIFRAGAIWCLSPHAKPVSLLQSLLCYLYFSSSALIFLVCKASSACSIQGTMGLYGDTRMFIPLFSSANKQGGLWDKIKWCSYAFPSFSHPKLLDKVWVLLSIVLRLSAKTSVIS